MNQSFRKTRPAFGFRAATLVAGMLLALFAQAAAAQCSAKARALDKCPPVRQPHATLTAHTGAPPVGPGPFERRTGTNNAHGIIFVGNKNAINSQPVPPEHSAGTSAINSQPVPPGRSQRHMPRPHAPAEPGGH